MLQRTDLEVARTGQEMRTLLDSVAKDTVTYPDKDVHLRRGILKVLLEEYEPLAILATTMACVSSARLLDQSNAGPDAVVSFVGPTIDQQLRVQITVADQGHQEALSRELISQGQMVFYNRAKHRDPNDRTKIHEYGPVLTTPRARAERHAQRITEAFQRKVEKYRNGTDALVIHVRGNVQSTHDFDWPTWVEEAISHSTNNPYRWVFLTMTPSQMRTLAHP